MRACHTYKTLRKGLIFPLGIFFFIACSGSRPLDNAELAVRLRDGADAVDWNEKNPLADSLRIQAETWLGIPYKYGGEGPDSIDCSAFVRAVYQQVGGIALPRRAAWQALQGYPVAREWLMPGDLLFFATPGQPEIDHVGLYLGSGRFLNATVSRGVAYSSLEEPYWQERYQRAIRIVLPLQESID